MRRRLGVVLTLVALTTIATLPFFVIGEDQKVGCCGGEMPVTHDSWMHFNQMRAFYRGLESGRIYPRWDDETHGGYGAPTLSFYPPGAYYVTSFFYFLTRDWAKVWIGFYWLASFGSALAIYWYARQTMSRAASLVVAAVYVFAPYHLINQYQRGAIAEFLSFVWTPLVLLFAERLCGTGSVSDLGLGKSEIDRDSDRLRSPYRTADQSSKSVRRVALSFAGLAASFGAFLWSHPPTAYQFLLVFGPCFAVWAIWRRRWRRLLIIGCALAFGSMIAATYFLPAIVEQSLVNYDDVERTWPYHASYVYDSAQRIYDRAANPFFVRIDRIWAFNAIAILIAALSLARFKRARAGLWIAAGMIACFLMTKYSEPIGRLIPRIETGVYSWRMLALASLALAMLAGACVSSSTVREGLAHAASPSLTVGLLTRLIAILILPGALAMSAWQVAWPVWRGQSFEPNFEHYNFATLPRGVPREAPPMDSAQLASAAGSVTIKRWTPESRELQVELEQPDQLQFRASNFAGWKATVDGKPVEIREGAVKNIVIDLPAGARSVTLEFRPTPVRRAGSLVTALSLALLVSIIVSAMRFKSV